jgi:hypothetical protein
VITEAILPFPKDDLIAKCSPRGWGQGGSVVWNSLFARGYIHVADLKPAPPRGAKTAMAYMMEHHTSTKRNHRMINEIIVTNLYCGVGDGWDIIVCGTIMDHCGRKTDAQREAEKLLEGQC